MGSRQEMKGIINLTNDRSGPFWMFNMPGTKKSLRMADVLQGFFLLKSVSFNFHDSLVLKIGG